MMVGILLGCVIGAFVQFALTVYFDRKLRRGYELKQLLKQIDEL